MPSPADHAIAYHERTKHHPHRFARSMGYLDWENQPDPFRRFAGAPVVRLPFERESGAGQAAAVDPAYDDLFPPYPAESAGAPREGPAIPPRPVTLASLAALLECSLAISAWKQFGDSRWALRVNPSSGNLHPTEAYVATGSLAGLPGGGGVFHYAPREHALERRTTIPEDVGVRLGREWPEGTFWIGLTSIPWRESWKYGERAYRYCQHDVGHALAAIGFAAARLGWRASHVEGLGDDDVARLLGLDREADFEGAEREHPDLLLAVIPRGGPARGEEGNPAERKPGVPASAERKDPADPNREEIAAEVLDAIARGTWHGKANRLSATHVDWEIIDGVADACRKPRGRAAALRTDLPTTTTPPPPVPSRPVLARTILLGRRSATDFDGETSISLPAFCHVLRRVLPGKAHPALGVLGAPALVDLVLFVHRVDDLEPGLYALVRSRERSDALRRAMRPGFSWERPGGVPRDLPLFLLAPGDRRREARGVSCGQEIAADGAFCIAMLAAFEEPLRRAGAWLYRRLHWEAGAIGQVLYLEAEAAGLRGTGIGCFFDDAVHDVLGIAGFAHQSLYHFTVGGPVEDPRLTTLPAYPPA